MPSPPHQRSVVGGHGGVWQRKPAARLHSAHGGLGGAALRGGRLQEHLPSGEHTPGGLWLDHVGFAPCVGLQFCASWSRLQGACSCVAVFKSSAKELGGLEPRHVPRSACLTLPLAASFHPPQVLMKNALVVTLVEAVSMGVVALAAALPAEVVALQVLTMWAANLATTALLDYTTRRSFFHSPEARQAFGRPLAGSPESAVSPGDGKGCQASMDAGDAAGERSLPAGFDWAARGLGGRRSSGSAVRRRSRVSRDQSMDLAAALLGRSGDGSIAYDTGPDSAGEGAGPSQRPRQQQPQQLQPAARGTPSQQSTLQLLASCSAAVLWGFGQPGGEEQQEEEGEYGRFRAQELSNLHRLDAASLLMLTVLPATRFDASSLLCVACLLHALLRVLLLSVRLPHRVQLRDKLLALPVLGMVQGVGMLTAELGGSRSMAAAAAQLPPGDSMGSLQDRLQALLVLGVLVPATLQVRRWEEEEMRCGVRGGWVDWGPAAAPAGKALPYRHTCLRNTCFSP